MGAGEELKCAQGLLSHKPVPRETSALEIPEPPCLSTGVPLTSGSQKRAKGSHRNIGTSHLSVQDPARPMGWRTWVSRTEE